MARLLETEDVRPASREVDLGGSPIHYLELGAGRPLLLLHGGGGGGANWFRVLGPLASDARVVAPDLPGFGLSGARRVAPPLGRSLAAALAEFLDALEFDACDVVGISLGGLVALRLAQLRPAAVRRLVLADAAGLGAELPFAVCLAALPLLGPALARPGRLGAAWVLHRLATADASAIPAPARRALLDYLYASARAVGTPLLARGVRDFVRRRAQAETLGDAELAAIRAPTLVLWGGRDAFFPLAHGRRAAALLPRSVLAVLPRSGHSPNWEDPAGFLRYVRPFLAGDGGLPG